MVSPPMRLDAMVKSMQARVLVADVPLNDLSAPFCHGFRPLAGVAATRGCRDGVGCVWRMMGTPE